MLNKEALSTLQAINDMSIKIGPEYSHSNFFFGSFDFFLNANLKYFGPIALNAINGTLKDIDNIKKATFSAFDNNDKLRLNNALYDVEEFNDIFNSHNKEDIINNITIYINEWEKLSKKNEVDISKEISKITHIQNNEIDFNIMENLRNELNYITKNLRKMESINEISEKINFDKEETSLQYKKLYADVSDVFQNKDSIINNINSFSLLDYLNKIEYYKPFEKISLIFSDIYNKVRIHNSSLNFSKAESYIESINNKNNITSAVQEFIFKKHIEDDIISTMTINGKYNKIIGFNDDSFIVEDNKGHSKIIENITHAKLIVEQIFKNELSHKLRKTPSISKLFIKELAKNISNLELALIAADTYIENEAVLKINSFNLEDNLKSGFEYADDEMNHVIKKHKIKQYAHSIASKKYLSLYNEKSYVILKKLFDDDIDIKVLQDYIGKKIASFKTPEEFNTALYKLYDTLNNFSYEIIKNKAKENKTSLIIDTEDLIVLKIDNYEQSQKLGSNSWCISRQEYYFNSYTEDNKNQYFIFDFTQTSENSDSMIGLTLTSKGDYHTAHLKDDNYLNMNEFLEDLQFKIILKNPEHFVNLSSIFKEKIEEFNLKNNVSKKIKMDI